MEMVILSVMCIAAAIYMISTNIKSKAPALQPIRIDERNEKRRR
jgi:hypothetical protein